MKVLGLDIGTNSIGWGIVDETQQKIQNCGVYIFPEGVKIEKGVESSKAAERTGYRLARRRNFRRKLRKYETLKVIINNNMCPLSLEELETWRKEKKYPLSEEFRKWYQTDEVNHWEPYYLRKKCVEEEATPYELGRALYHLAQRRGFLSNRKETTKETEGAVKSEIDELSKAKGDKTLGQYFYELKQSREKVRGHYTSRKLHYEEEFNKICEVQKISNALKKELYNAIFFQRKLKSQKFLVGKCTLEPKKPRCPISHFDYEEFRMLSFINSIKVAKNETEDDSQSFVFLTENERQSILPLFFRVSKSSFTFKDIAKKIAGKKEYWKFNYRDDTNVAGCPVSAAFLNIFGESWQKTQIGQYDINDIWHVLFDFDDDEKLHAFALNRLSLDENQINRFCSIHLQQGYANLSLKAIRKILPFLRKGYIYSHAVFLANIPTMIGEETYRQNADKIEAKVKELTDTLKEKNNDIVLTNRCIDAIFKDEKHDFHSEEWDKSILQKELIDLYTKKKWSEFSPEKQASIQNTVVDKINEVLKIAVTKNPNDYKYPLLRTDDLILEYLDQQGFELKKNITLYHPSDVEYTFENPIVIDGKTYLGSPRTPSVKNPVAMRALFQLRKLINYLLKTEQIDTYTRINVELANEVNDKNWRKAIEDFNRDNQKKNEEYKQRIIELCKEAGFDIIPTDSDIKKYRLWIEQKQRCPYTNKQINITDLFGPNPKFDFEHTIPRSLSYDDSLENLTLCDSHFNRDVKKQHIPYELPNYEEISKRFQGFYEDCIDDCLSRIERNIIRGGYVDPAIKDKRIVARHKAQLELDYYKGKLKRFTTTQVTGGFKHSQLNDTRIITKFALSYLKSLFDYVQPVNGSMTDLFKRQWGLLGREETKDRTNYKHHAVDALTIACVNRSKFNLLCECIKNSSDGVHLKFEKPWDSFDNDVLSAVQYLIPKHAVDDNSLRQSKKILKTRKGKPVLKKGKPVYIQGFTARGSLHKDTVYGCIMTPPEKGVESQKIFVQSIPCASLTKDKINSIIDKGIRNTANSNIDTGKQTLQDIQEKGILLPYKINGKEVYAKKVRIDAGLKNPIPLKKHSTASLSKKGYKQYYYTNNDENYCVVLYRCITSKGKELRDYFVSNLLMSVSSKKNNEPLYPPELTIKTNKLEIYKILKKGQIIIMQNTFDENVFELSKNELFSRIYRIVGIAAKPDGRLKLVHSQIQETWRGEKILFTNNTEKFLRISSNSLHCLIEGVDFTISPTGDIVKKK